jgi:hypothetical protein
MATRRAMESIQKVTLVSEGGATEEGGAFFNHARFDVASGLLLLANTKRNALYTLQLQVIDHPVIPPGVGSAVERVAH